MNRLAQEGSPYLRHAAQQQVDWYPWSDDALRAAKREDKPVFVSSGAVWCHWCHVMARESFEDVETARLLNELFINIKLDRDERPDVDFRLQQAVAAMGSATGWPLSVFLTPEGEPFFGGTYFPREERAGRPGFKQVLQAVSNFYRHKKGDVKSYAASIIDALAPDHVQPEIVKEEMLEDARGKILAAFDHENGGFGTAPKFPMAGAVEFLLRCFSFGPDREAGQAARQTLVAMARGGFHDVLGGGFHRYSVDESWIVPHFEKMISDNAELLRNYIEGCSAFGDEQLKDIAEDIVRFINAELAGPQGGFYASQDADVSGDEGTYFTWTDAELREVLTSDEYEVVCLALLDPRGHLAHDRSKQVLAVNEEPAEVAAKNKKSVGDVVNHIAEAKAKLRARRSLRTPPFVDRSLYTSLNGQMIAAYFRAFMVLKKPDLSRFAAKSLERVLNDRFDGKQLFHSAGVRAQLDDYVHLIDALIAGYEATADRSWLERADFFMELCKEKFWDRAEGGFYDSDEEVLGVRLKRIEDVPHPSANAIAIKLLLKLSLLTGKDAYRSDAERALNLFAGPALAMGVHAGAFFCALHSYFNYSTLQIEAAPESEIAREARTAAVRCHSSIIYADDNRRVIHCFKGVCSKPLTDTAAFSVLLCNHS